MHYFYEINDPQVEFNELGSVLPNNFSLSTEGDKFVLDVKAHKGLSDGQVNQQVQRECDRWYFLTGRQLSPNLIRKKDKNGSVTGYGQISLGAHITQHSDPRVTTQDWLKYPELAIQLKLWELANLPDLQIAPKINLLFQIIEIDFIPREDKKKRKHYPKYDDIKNPPHPRTESKLLRDLASHGKQTMGNPELQDYCKYLSIPAESHDPTDQEFVSILTQRTKILEEEARQIIKSKITLRD